MELEREFWEKGKEVTSSYVAETPKPPLAFISQGSWLLLIRPWPRFPICKVGTDATDRSFRTPENMGTGTLISRAPSPQYLALLGAAQVLREPCAK